MQAEIDLNQSVVRRAYEIGRLRSSSWRALVVALPIALLGWATSGASSLVMMPLAIAIWIFLYWRGDALLRGGVYGLLGGTITSLLPMSLLRPCCVPDLRASLRMSAECCTTTMPSACLGAGAIVGMVLAATVPFGKATWWKSAIGMALGMTSVAILKCVGLFAGETVGLLGGLIAGVAASMAARAVLGSFQKNRS